MRTWPGSPAGGALAVAVLAAAFSFEGCFFCSMGILGDALDPQIRGCWQALSGPAMGWLTIDHVAPQERTIDPEDFGCYDYEVNETVFSGAGSGLPTLGLGAGPWVFRGRVSVGLGENGISRARMTITTDNRPDDVEFTIGHYLAGAASPGSAEQLAFEDDEGVAVQSMIRCGP